MNCEASYCKSLILACYCWIWTFAVWSRTGASSFILSFMNCWTIYLCCVYIPSVNILFFYVHLISMSSISWCCQLITIALKEFSSGVLASDIYASCIVLNNLSLARCIVLYCLIFYFICTGCAAISLNYVLIALKVSSSATIFASLSSLFTA